MKLEHILAIGAATLAACGRPRLDSSLSNPSIFNFYNPPHEATITPTDMPSSYSLNVFEVPNEEKKLYFRLDSGEIINVSYTVAPPLRFDDKKDEPAKKMLLLRKSVVSSPGAHTAEAWRKIDGKTYYTKVEFCVNPRTE